MLKSKIHFSKSGYCQMGAIGVKTHKNNKILGLGPYICYATPLRSISCPARQPGEKKYENYSEPHRVTTHFKAYQILNVAYCLRFLISKAVQKLLADQNAEF